jgi:threonine/homoserine/homoserine lactone efflux protein
VVLDGISGGCADGPRQHAGYPPWRWRHTVACGIGSISGDLILFSLVIFGGDYFFPDLSNPVLQTILAARGAIVLFPLGIYFLVRAVKEPLRA